ncbi:MAG: acyl-CoA dehydrogenase family protein [Candidatus Paceibacterota bacterium]
MTEVTSNEYLLEPNHIELRERCREFSKNFIRPAAKEVDTNKDIPLDLYREAAEKGFYRSEFFIEIGMDPTGLSSAIVAEEFAYGDAGLALALLYPALPLTALTLTGTPKQVSSLLPTLLGTVNDPKLISFAASEPEAGSDVAAFTTTARKEGDYYVLNGRKRWAGNSSKADTYFIVASLDLDLGPKAQAVFIVDDANPGLSFSEPFEKLGLRGMTHADIFINEVKVHKDMLLGGEERAKTKLEKLKASSNLVQEQSAMQTFSATRPFVAALAVGLARASHEEALSYAKTRKAFGKSIIHHQQIADQLARQRMLIDAARLLTYRAATLTAQQHKQSAAEGSQAKLFAAEMVRDVTATSITIAGGLGFTTMMNLERMYRDAPIFSIFEGTNQIQSLIIASSISNEKIR